MAEEKKQPNAENGAGGAAAGTDAQQAGKAQKAPEGKVQSDTFHKENLTEKDKQAKAAAEKQEQKKKRRKRRFVMKVVVVIVVIIAALAAFLFYRSFKAKQEKASEVASNTTKVSRGTISSELTGSGTLAAKDTYSITSLVEGEILSADFEEGDQVEKGQVLYRIDSSDMDTTIKNAQTSLSDAKEDLADAQKDLAEAQSKYAGNSYKSTETGYIKTLYIKAGDKINNGTKIADIYDDSTMILRVPFLNYEAQSIPEGADVTVTLASTGEQLAGRVKSVSTMDETLNGGVVVRYVSIYVSNPGGLSTSDTAFATYGELSSVEDGSFAANLETSIMADLDGSVEIAAVSVNEGSYVTKGQAIFSITANSMEDLLDNYEKAVKSAESALDKAENSQEDADNKLEDYTITAPISGTVISKTSKAGDNITKSSSGSSTMAEIYDLSELTFEMSIDETDIDKVEVGQKVKVSADAYEGQTFEGTVTNVSLLSSYSSGVTNYPVTVTLTDAGDLLPGMNVDGTIILSESEDTLMIPADALQRGDIVFVKGKNKGNTDDVPEAVLAQMPEGFSAVKVETGITNDDNVEILSGLSEDDEVYYVPSSSSSGFMFGGMGGGPGGMGGAPGGGGPGGGPR